MSSKCVVAGAACKSDPGHADDLILLFSVSEVKVFPFFLPHERFANREKGILRLIIFASLPVMMV
jgi:hypothetical protein